MCTGFIAQFDLSDDPAIIAAWKPATIPDGPGREIRYSGNTRLRDERCEHPHDADLHRAGGNTRLDAQRFTPFGQVASGRGVVDPLVRGK
jgi:hypothetical protein